MLHRILKGSFWAALVVLTLFTFLAACGNAAHTEKLELEVLALRAQHRTLEAFQIDLAGTKAPQEVRMPPRVRQGSL